jgi:hypothetical protein
MNNSKIKRRRRPNPRVASLYSILFVSYLFNSWETAGFLASGSEAAASITEDSISYLYSSWDDSWLH